MDPKNLIALNKEINNVTEISFPYWWAFQGEESARDNSAKKIVVFFGNDMATFTKNGMNPDSYIQKCNECLSYIQREFSDCDLYYRPHPADKIERASLDLTGFSFFKDELNAELFLFNNHNRIKSVLSVGSAASYSAYAMGLDAHVFYKYFNGIFDNEFIKQLDEFYYNMPTSFFITSPNISRVDNARILKKDDTLEEIFKKEINQDTGKVWLVAFTVEYAVLLIALSKLIKFLRPNTKIGLIVSRHTYWDKLGRGYLSKYFDEFIVWPRINYSLRPAKLWHTFKTAVEISRFNINKKDVLISIIQNSFVENCLNSYYGKNFKIGLIADKDLNLFYNSKNSIYTQNADFRFSKASWFFNRILEPLLGLNRSVFMFYNQGGGLFINRYQKPLNEIFDKVVIMKASQANK